MKKIHFLQCFDVADAVKDGIDDFNRLSGYAAKKSKVIVPEKKVRVKLSVKFIWLAVIPLLSRILK
jgi:hypothetical protein